MTFIIPEGRPNPNSLIFGIIIFKPAPLQSERYLGNNDVLFTLKCGVSFLISVYNF